MTRLLGVCALLLALLVARAESAPPVLSDSARAQKHFEAGRALFDLGNFGDAIREWKAGYALAPLPGFLLNVGHAHRKLDELAEAASAYREYLRIIPHDHASRPTVLALAEEAERELARRPPAAKPEPSAPPAVLTATIQPSVVASAPVAVRPSARFKHRTAWIIGGVVIGAVVIAGATLGGVLGASASRDWCGGASTIGCISAR